MKKNIFVLLFFISVNEIYSQDLYEDNDCDGYPSSRYYDYNYSNCSATAYSSNDFDCDDYDPNVNVPRVFFLDSDGDGLGDANSPTADLYCYPPYQYVLDNSDCNDGDSNIGSAITFYRDLDNDGFGDVNATIFGQGCNPPIGYVLNNLDCDDTNKSLNPNTDWFSDVDGDGFITAADGPPAYTQCLKPAGNYLVMSDSKNHWIHSMAYDIKGTTISSTRVFYDDLGKSDVSLSKDFQNNKVWGTETIFDEKGRPFRTSFIAPSTSNSFEKTSFLRPAGSLNASSIASTLTLSRPILTNLNSIATQSITSSTTIAAGATVSFKAPQIILADGFTAGPGFTATAAIVNEDVAQPNLYQYYSDANTAEPYQATATYPFSEVVYDELNPGNTVKVIGGNKINGEWKTGFSYTLPAAQEMYYAFGAAYFDGDMQAQGEVVVTKFFKTIVQDANGVENVSFSDGEGKVLATGTSGRGSAYPVVSLIGTQGFIDVHIPLGVSPAALIGSASDYKIYNLKTGALHTGSLLGGNFYRVEAVVVPTAEPVAYITGGGVIYSAGAKGVTYTVNYAEFALNYYDKTGRLSKTIQPKGYQNNISIMAAPTHTLATTYAYNTLGQVTAVTSPDEGTSRFAYRKDGQIRYSQNALQNDTKVSYTEYDTLGRPIESGVISDAVGIWASAIANLDGSLLTGTRSEQTFTIYDDYKDFTSSYTIPANLDMAALLTSNGLNATQYVPNNLSGNVAVTFNDSSFTWYSYDLYGRTEWLVQNILGFGLKTVHYYYDHNSNIRKVIYQKDVASEMFVHQYTYQVDGALLTVATSLDNVNFKEHAKYKYYQTGELKRVELAQGLQGIDYVYTLGGALKSINHPSLEAANDPGGDTNDVFGVTLDYYDGDYMRSNRNISTSPTVAGFNQDNYDGNIKASRWANRQKDVPNPLVAASATNTAQQRGYLYNYNANKWLTQSSFGNVSGNAISPGTAFKEGDITYDKNGNILSLQRAKEDGTVIDNFSYNYDKGNNQLTHVDDAVLGNADIQDLKDQNTNNYVYDVLGRMIENVAEGLKYTYNTQGLVTKITKYNNPIVNFSYNERGFRVYKETTNFTRGGMLVYREYYALDLAGNIMAVYSKSSSKGDPIVLKEYPIFGASRLGIYKKQTGLANYEITDHLGNVRAVIQENPNIFSILLSYADYYSFGEQLPSRNTTSDYRYAFQGQELDKETGMEAFQLRLWDGRIGRWLSPDPYGQHFSPYSGMGNNPVSHIDADGGYETWLGAFFGWVGGGFSGSITSNPAGEGNTDASRNYGILQKSGSYDTSSLRNSSTGATELGGVTLPFIKYKSSSLAGCTGDCDGWLKSEYIGPTPIPTYYKREKSIDMVDLAAQKHDAGYILMGADGVDGALFNTKVLKYDMQLYDESKMVYDGYYNGMIDTQTGKPISIATQARAAAVMGAFGPIIQYKKIEVLYPTFFPTMKFVIKSMHHLPY